MRGGRMSKWLVTFEYDFSVPERKNKFVEFESKYPTEEEIQELIKKNIKITHYTWGGEFGERCESKNYPIILFMQRLE